MQTNKKKVKFELNLFISRDSNYLNIVKLEQTFSTVRTFYLDKVFDVYIDTTSFTLKQENTIIDLKRPMNLNVFFPCSIDEINFMICNHHNYDNFYYNQFKNRQWYALWTAIKKTDHINWYNHPEKAENYSNKILSHSHLENNNIPVLKTCFVTHSQINLINMSSFLIKNLSDTDHISEKEHFTPQLVNKQKEIHGCKFPFISQEYIKSTLEYRVYIFNMNQYVIMEIKLPSKKDISYKNINVNELSLSVIKNPPCNLLEIIKKTIKTIDLDYYCLDIINDNYNFKIIDLNPHGSWHWLPDDIKNMIDDKFLKSIIHRACTL